MWDKDVLKKVLGKNFELFQDYFSVNKIGLWEDNKYVLKKENDDDFFTKKYNISAKTLN